MCGDVSFNSFFIFAQIWPSPSGKNLKVIIIQSSSFTEKLLPVPIESEVFTHKVPQLFVPKVQPNHLF